MDGTIYLYENTGSEQFYNFEYFNDNYGDIDVLFRSSPLVYDNDSDGDLDLYVGSGNNSLKLYENLGGSYFLNENSSIDNLGKNIAPSIYADIYNKGLVIGLSTGGMYYIPLCNSDFNSDNSINVIDVVQLIVYILDMYANNLDEDCLDLNNDLVVDVLDVVELINYILNI